MAVGHAYVPYSVPENVVERDVELVGGSGKDGGGGGKTRGGRGEDFRGKRERRRETRGHSCLAVRAGLKCWSAPTFELCNVLGVVRFSGPTFLAHSVVVFSVPRRRSGSSDTRVASVAFVLLTSTGCVTDTWPRRLHRCADQKKKKHWGRWDGGQVQISLGL